MRLASSCFTSNEDYVGAALPGTTKFLLRDQTILFVTVPRFLVHTFYIRVPTYDG